MVGDLDIDVSKPSNLLTTEEVNQINLLFAASKTKDVQAKSKINLDERLPRKISTRARRRNYQKDSLSDEIFDNGSSVVFVASVQWYYNRSTGGEYGFLYNRELGDIHFRGSVVEGVEPRSLSEGRLVTVTAEKLNIKNGRRRKVLKVSPIEHELNVDFLVYGLRRYIGYSERVPLLLKALKTNSDLLQDSHKEKLLELVEKLESEEIKSKSSLVIRMQIAQITGVEFNHEGVSEDELFKLWRSGADIGDISRIADRIVIFAKGNKQAFLMPGFKNMEPVEKKFLLERLIDEALKEWEDGHLEAELYLILDASRRNGVELSFEKYSDSMRLLFWKIGFDIKPSLPHLLDYLAKYYNTLKGSMSERIEAILSDDELLLKKLSDQEISDLFALIHFNTDKVNNEKAYTLFHLLMHFSFSEDIRKEAIDNFYNKATSFYRLRMFVDDYVEVVDFGDAVLYTGLLSQDKQKVFLKKVAYLKSKGLLDISIDDLDRVLVTDYPTSKIAEELDGSKIDYSVSVIIHILKEMLKGEKLTLSRIFQYVADIINEPKDIIRLTGFFDKCEGRTLLRASQYRDENGEQAVEYIKEVVEKLKPRFSDYCDGKKAYNRDGTLALSKKEEKEFYWCENSPCFETCRNLHKQEDWKNYSLKDLFKIFEVSCDDDNYSQLIGVLNKCNRYFEHLNCRSCGEILHPTGKENYGFYRVSNFSCSNIDCQEPDKNVYLSHCANGACLDLVDSRDTVRCKPSGTEENCGWYICNYCFACCSTSKLKQRKDNLEYLGRKYNCHTEGHKDKHEICCNKCGNVMREIQVMGDLYQKQLRWFIKNKDSHANISKHGKRSNDGKWWFIWNIGRMEHAAYRSQLQNLMINGFQIPDFHDELNTSQLISEPFNDPRPGLSNYSCKNCGNELILNDKEEMDAHRKSAIMYYHFNKRLDEHN